MNWFEGVGFSGLLIIIAAVFAVVASIRQSRRWLVCSCVVGVLSLLLCLASLYEILGYLGASG